MSIIKDLQADKMHRKLISESKLIEATVPSSSHDEGPYHAAHYADSRWGSLRYESIPQRHHEAMLDHHIAASFHHGDKSKMNPRTRDHHEKIMAKHDEAAEHHEKAIDLLNAYGKDHPVYQSQRNKANAASKKLA